MLLVHASPKTLEPYRTPELGVLCSPRNVYADDIQAWPWAADNDCFQGLDEKRYVAMLHRIRDRAGCLFVVVPDVVGDHKETFRYWRLWHEVVAEVTGHPIAFVAQDGCERPPWEQMDCLFIGGTTKFKCSEQARKLVAEAKRQQMWVHMGRVNTDRRMRLAESWGVDSVDGTSVSRFRDTHLPKRLAQAARPRQMGLHEEAA
jgi:hypothetical protein